MTAQRSRVLVLTCLLVVPKAGASTLRVEKAMQDLETLVAATSLLHADLGRVPSAEEWPALLLQAPAGVEGWRGPYLKTTRMDPWGRPYLFAVHPGGQGFGIYSPGINGLDEGGRNDDVSSWAGYDRERYFHNARRNCLVAVILAIGSLLGLGYGWFAYHRSVYDPHASE